MSAVGEAAHEEDVTALQALVAGDRQAGLVGVVVPRRRTRRARSSRSRAARDALLALAETAAGVLDARSVATAKGVVRLAVGHLDLAADLGPTPTTPWSTTPVTSSSSRPAPPGAPPGRRGEHPGPRRGSGPGGRPATRRGGMGGKLCIHPDQVEVVRQAFAPTAEEVAWARLVLEGGDGVDVADGQMVDRPVLLRAQALLARSESAS
ncbi:aldolase/citrate lyase family protein [Janibacter melonis]|uniref:aldolase/citrate lyase family protein n=1 Tax=Janibacter melonis TaxID=262209 RepID=UPI0020949B48|nr:aldolase/citrate lyase family protein [Janibacter melonis]